MHYLRSPMSPTSCQIATNSSKHTPIPLLSCADSHSPSSPSLPPFLFHCSPPFYYPAPSLNPAHVPFALTRFTGLPRQPISVSAKRTSTAVPALSSSLSPNIPFVPTESRRLACRCHPVSVKGTLGEPSGEKALQQGSERGAREVAGKGL